MNREIKFRAWVKSYDDSDGVMMDMPASLTKFDFEDGWVLSFTDYPEFYGHEGYENRKPHEYHLMQWTGFNDRNGAEIFESDVLVSESGSNTVTVYWGTYKAKIKGWPDGMDELEMTGWMVENIKTKQREPLDSSMIGGTVLGNLHEHPHLVNR